IAQASRFGDTHLLNGTGQTFDFQVDIHNDDFQDRISFDTTTISATNSDLNIEDFDFSSKEGAQSALDTIDQAQRQVNGSRSTLGAIQNRLTSTTDNLGEM